MNGIDLIWDSWDHIDLKQPQNCKLNFKEKMVPISNSNFYYKNSYFFLIYCYEMKFPHVLKINLEQFFRYTRCTCHNLRSKYNHLPWNTLYYRVTHMQVTLLQRFLNRVYEVFGVILIIFIKYGLWTIDKYNNNRFYSYNMPKMTSFNFYA